MDDILRFGGLVRLAVCRVLKGHPAIAGLGHCPHHLCVQIAGIDLAVIELFFLSLYVSSLKLVPVQVREMSQGLGSNSDQTPPASTRFIKRSGIQFARFK